MSNQDDFTNDDSRFAPRGDVDLPPLPDAPVADDAEDEADAPPTDALALDMDNLAAEMAAYTDELDTPDPEDTLTLARTVEIRVPGEAETEPEPLDTDLYADDNIEDPQSDADIDVDLALAAVTGLDEMIEQREAAAAAEAERERKLIAAEEARERNRAEDAARITAMLDNPLPAPGTIPLGRGQVASLLPGIALVGVGVWLTYAYATDSAPATLAVMGVLAGVFAVGLLGAWLGSGRWSRGALFFVLWGALTVGAVWAAGVYLQPVARVPILLGALGAAFLLTAVLARPMSGVFALPGLVLFVIAGLVLAFGLGAVPPVLVNTLSTGWIAVAVLCGLIVLLPLVRRLRR